MSYFRENYRIHHDFSHLNKAIEQIEKVTILNNEKQSVVDSVWSFILLKSNKTCS